MTDKLDGKAWASTNNLLIVVSECVIVALMTLRYLNPAGAAVVILLMLGGYLFSVYGHGPASSQLASTTGRPGDYE